MSAKPILAGGSTLARWVKAGGTPELAGSWVPWVYRWRGFLFDAGMSLTRKGIMPNPAFADGEGLLFLMGFWRSGTTILHELIAAAPGWTAPKTWQCMDPLDSFRRQEPLSVSTVQRPMDDLKISTHSPQEDEFALMALGIPSLHLGFLDPRRLPSLQPLMDSSYWTSPESGQWLGTLVDFLHTCQEPLRTRLVVKSPPHVFRAKALCRHFPKARFVWILRNPQDVWNSNLKMWTAMTQLYGLWRPAENGLESFLERALDSYRLILEELQTSGDLQKSSVLSYEDLVSNPSVALNSLSNLLGLEGTSASDWIQAAKLRLRPPPPVSAQSLKHSTFEVLDSLKFEQEAILAQHRS